MCKETRLLMNEQQTSSFTPAALQIDELRSQEFLLHLLLSNQLFVLTYGFSVESILKYNVERKK